MVRFVYSGQIRRIDRIDRIGRIGRINPYVAYRIASFIWATMFRSDAAFLARGASLR